MKKFTLIFVCLFISFNNHAQEFNGVWESEGYGFILNIEDDEMEIYQYTSISNIYDDYYELDGNTIVDGDDLEGVFSIENSQLVLTQPGGTIIYFNLLNQMPSITPETDQPLFNFNIFWRTYEDWFAFFEILDINWQEEYDFYAAQVDSTTTPEELFEIMSNLLANLNDGHSFLDPVGISGYFEGGPPISPLWYDYEYEMMDLIEDEYIEGGNYEYSDSEFITYGIINGNIGYLAVNSMDGFSNSDLEIDDNIQFEIEIEEALTWLQNTDALIIDVRFNYGGYDSNSRILGNRLTNESLQVYSKQARVGSYTEFADPIFFNIQPDGTQYVDKPVVVLTSDATLSAADVFALLAKEITCVTLIGEHTYGIFSDNYTKYLPNGWEFGISPERYLNNEGINYEQIGVPPDVEVIGSLEDFYNDIDNILEVAIDQIFDSCDIAGVNEINGIELLIYPNPVRDILKIQLKSNTNTNLFDWSIIDVFGKIVQEGTSYKTSFKINLKNKSNGIYFFKLKNQSQVSKFIILE